AELMADCQISSVYLALSGKHISCQNEIGMVPISEEEVTQEDVENVVHTAKSVRVRDEHRVLHVIPQEYAIDYQEGIKNPVGVIMIRPALRHSEDKAGNRRDNTAHFPPRATCHRLFSLNAERKAGEQYHL
ncbi:cell division protein FtsA, partial [Salmonella enterica subsp. enterica serovar Heidelberg str. RI-11-014319]